MKLHCNVALSLNGRRRLVRMVIEEGRSIAAPPNQGVGFIVHLVGLVGWVLGLAGASLGVL